MVASFNGHVEVVDKLLQHGATIDLQTEVCVMPRTKINFSRFDSVSYYTKASTVFSGISRNLFKNAHMRFILWMLRKQGITIDDVCTYM